MQSDLDRKILELRRTWSAIVCSVSNVSVITRNGDEPFKPFANIAVGSQVLGSLGATASADAPNKREIIAQVLGRLREWISRQRSASRLPCTALRLENAIRAMCVAHVQCDAEAIMRDLVRDGVISLAQETVTVHATQDGSGQQAPALQSWAGSPSNDASYYSIATLIERDSTPPTAVSSRNAHGARVSSYTSSFRSKTPLSPTTSASASPSRHRAPYAPIVSGDADIDETEAGASDEEDATEDRHHFTPVSVDVPFPTLDEQHRIGVAKARAWAQRSIKGTMPARVVVQELKSVGNIKLSLDPFKFIEKLARELRLLDIKQDGTLVWRQVV